VTERIAAREAARSVSFKAADDLRKELEARVLCSKTREGGRGAGNDEGPPLIVRIAHWVNVRGADHDHERLEDLQRLAAVRLAFPMVTLGIWLPARCWHFAAMWLFALNGIVYVAYGILSGISAASCCRSRR
jgi:hypothetical protein